MKVPQMIGTTGTTFTVVGVFAAGHIGYRELGGGSFRVRIAEYKDKSDLNGLLPNWKQPDESSVRTRRFSTVVNSVEGLGEAIAAGSQALSVASKGVVVSAPAVMAPSINTLTAKIASAQAKFEAAEAALESARDAYDLAEDELNRLNDLQDQLEEVLAA